MKFQVISEWGVPCRTPRCSGFATLSRMVLKRGVKHPWPEERGVGTCETCGCQYSVRLDEIEHRLIEKHQQATDPELPQQVRNRSTHTHLCDECGDSFMCYGREAAETCQALRICQRCVEDAR